MKKSNTKKKGGERQGKEHHTYKKKKNYTEKRERKNVKKETHSVIRQIFSTPADFPSVNFFPTICTTRIPYSHAPVANRKVGAMRKVTGAAYQTKISWFEGFR